MRSDKPNLAAATVQHQTSDYTTVTEVGGNLVSREALEMAWTRYAFAARFCPGKAVLEIACGPGPGLGHLASRARTLVGGDYTAAHLGLARAHYGARVPLARLDAHALPFRSASFDVVILFEAIYFLEQIERVIRECRDVLADDGILVIATPNPERRGFNPAPFSVQYPTAAGLDQMLRAERFSVDLYGGFADVDGGFRGRALTLARQIAVGLHLIPKTMKGKQLLKRLAFGKLYPFPAEVSADTSAYYEPIPLPAADAEASFKVLYAVATKRPHGATAS